MPLLGINRDYASPGNREVYIIIYVYIIYHT